MEILYSPKAGGIHFISVAFRPAVIGLLVGLLVTNFVPNRSIFLLGGLCLFDQRIWNIISKHSFHLFCQRTVHTNLAHCREGGVRTICENIHLVQLTLS